MHSILSLCQIPDHTNNNSEHAILRTRMILFRRSAQAARGLCCLPELYLYSVTSLQNMGAEEVYLTIIYGINGFHEVLVSSSVDCLNIWITLWQFHDVCHNLFAIVLVNQASTGKLGLESCTQEDKSDADIKGQVLKAWVPSADSVWVFCGGGACTCLHLQAVH